ncbi:MAG: hypothetical protein SWO11_03440 [Thermodesulfobacteriota bacterium]|nr:hypothetical protein [Thermodesulfobacteriota bacterium]
MKSFVVGLVTVYLVFGTLLSRPINSAQNLHSTTSQTEYGEAGPYTMVSETFENSKWSLSRKGEPVTVFLPAELSEPVPVLFFSHGFGSTKWISYRTLVTHLVSKGLAVVYSPYPILSSSISKRYEIMWNGFKEATERYTTKFNLQKVGFLGHSFGAGAVPAMAWKGLIEKGWGTQAAFLFMMAPWYSYEINDSQLENFPEHANLIIQVYNEDYVCDHRMAIDIFTKIAILDSKKAYYNVVEGEFDANHMVPLDREDNDLDYLAIRSPLDALIDCTFGGYDPYRARDYALEGQGIHFQHTVTKSPSPVANESRYMSSWSSLLNPRT